MNYIKGIRLSSIPHNEYPFNIPAVRHLNKAGGITLDKPVTFLVGENGTGKSTLVEAIAVAMGFNAEGGSRDFYFNTRKTHSDLYEHLQIIKSVRPNDGFFLRAESFYNTASYLEENSTLLRYGGVSFHEQSHGESFLSFKTVLCFRCLSMQLLGMYLVERTYMKLCVSRQLMPEIMDLQMME